MSSRQPKTTWSRHLVPLPRIWLMTDERVDDALLLASVRRLPKGSGVVFRHYSCSQAQRCILFRKISAISTRRHLTLLNAGPKMKRADGRHVSARHLASMHMPRTRHRDLLSVSVHTMREIFAARCAGADLVFLSPVYPTRSHQDTKPLGPLRFAALARRCAAPVIALGGMNGKKFRRLAPLGAHGWAAIDALTLSES